MTSIKIVQNYGNTTAPCMWTNDLKTKTKPSNVTFKWRFSPSKMQWHHKGWRHCLTSESKGRFFLIIFFLINDWLSMMSGHSTNPIFFNKKITTSRTLAKPHPLRSITSRFCFSPHSLSKWTSYVYHPLFKSWYYLKFESNHFWCYFPMPWRRKETLHIQRLLFQRKKRLLFQPVAEKLKHLVYASQFWIFS